MKITLVRYERLFNTGNYQNQKAGAEALLEEGDSPEAAFTALRALVADQDPDLIAARAVLAHPDGHPAWAVRQARERLGLPEPPPSATAPDPEAPRPALEEADALAGFD